MSRRSGRPHGTVSSAGPFFDLCDDLAEEGHLRGHVWASYAMTTLCNWHVEPTRFPQSNAKVYCAISRCTWKVSKAWLLQLDGIATCWRFICSSRALVSTATLSVGHPLTDLTYPHMLQRVCDGLDNPSLSRARHVICDQCVDSTISASKGLLHVGLFVSGMDGHYSTGMQQYQQHPNLTKAL